MKVVDTNFKPLDRSQIDLEKGYLMPGRAIKEDVTPIDNITKFAWDDEDFEDVEIYQLYQDNKVEHTPNDDRDSMLVDLEYRLTLLELDLQTNKV